MPGGGGGRISSEVELMSVRSDASTDAEAFPPFYQRQNARGASTSGEFDRRKDMVELRCPPRLTDEDVGDDRVEYAPMPEQKKLGYFSTAALIVSKMIGTGVFAKPSVVLENCGGRGVALFLWVACGLMSLAGCATLPSFPFPSLPLSFFFLSFSFLSPICSHLLLFSVFFFSSLFNAGDFAYPN